MCQTHPAHPAVRRHAKGILTKAAWVVFLLLRFAPSRSSKILFFPLFPLGYFEYGRSKIVTVLCFFVIPTQNTDFFLSSRTGELRDNKAHDIGRLAVSGYLHSF